MTALAADLGVEVEFVPTDWKTLVNGVVAGKYHITGSASVSPARAKAAGYSDSYFSLITVPLTLKTNADRFNGLGRSERARRDRRGHARHDAGAAGQAYLPNATHKIVEAPARDFQEVLAGRADAHITSNVEAFKLVDQYPEMMIVPVEDGVAPTPIAMLLPQDDQIWINYVNTWIRLQEDRGLFYELGSKWRLAE
jgi:cyclohexadienyl dehydratase